MIHSDDLALETAGDDADLVNSGVLVYNASAARARPDADERTVIVMGLSRGGTSMAAGVLAQLGVFMGEHMHPANLEDSEVYACLNEDDGAKLDALVARRNREHDVWGFKTTDSFRHFTHFVNRFRNPHFVLVVRDVVSIVARKLSAGVLQPDRGFENILLNLAGYSRLFTFLQVQDAPSMMVSYEKAVLKSDAFVRATARFVGCTDEERIQAAADSVRIDNEVYLASVAKQRDRARGTS